MNLGIVESDWIGMAGPTGSTFASEEWHFLCRSGGFDALQKNHLFLRCDGSPQAGGSVSTLTVLVPVPWGTGNVTTPPAQLTVNGSKGMVTLGKHTYRFGEKGVEFSR